MATFDEPLEAFKVIEPRHRQLVWDTLNELIRRSNVDAKKNRATVAQFNKASENLDTASARLRRWKAFGTFLTVLFWVLTIFAIVGIVTIMQDEEFEAPLDLLLGIGCGVALAITLKFLLVKPKILSYTKTISALEQLRHELLKQAWEEMRSLNLLFTWDTVTDLLRKALPELHFDKNFRHTQFEDLVASLQLKKQVTSHISVLNLQTGHLRGNPFALVKGRTLEWGQKTYTGSITVSVRKTRINADGKRESYTAFETLYAEVTRPIPEFPTKSFLLFGSDAAPNLYFTRSPSKHSGKADTFFNRWAKRRTTKKLEAFSRNLDDEYGFTMMANREFETLFHATDRTDEREFRLLFTPYAQQQMVKLLNDTKVGFGDNFHMIKDARATLLFPEHLEDVDQSLNPVDFWNYDLEALKRHFVTFNTNYFKALYFALAPLMTIPLYCQQSARAEKANAVQKFETSAWENELIANAYGEEHFAHPHSATPNLIKTVTTRHGDATIFKATAHGFSENLRVEHVPVYDSNGRCHHVPVEWIEYRPVKQTHQVVVIPDHTINPNGPRSHAEALALLHENGYSVDQCHSIRATYVALI